MHVCKKCSKGFGTPGARAQHMQMAHPAGGNVGQSRAAAPAAAPPAARSARRRRRRKPAEGNPGVVKVKGAVLTQSGFSSEYLNQLPAQARELVSGSHLPTIMGKVWVGAMLSPGHADMTAKPKIPDNDTQMSVAQRYLRADVEMKYPFPKDPAVEDEIWNLYYLHVPSPAIPILAVAVKGDAAFEWYDMYYGLDAWQMQANENLAAIAFTNAGFTGGSLATADPIPSVHVSVMTMANSDAGWRNIGVTAAPGIISTRRAAKVLETWASWRLTMSSVTAEMSVSHLRDQGIVLTTSVGRYAELGGFNFDQTTLLADGSGPDRVVVDVLPLSPPPYGLDRNWRATADLPVVGIDEAAYAQVAPCDVSGYRTYVVAPTMGFEDCKALIPFQQTDVVKRVAREGAYTMLAPRGQPHNYISSCCSPVWGFVHDDSDKSTIEPYFFRALRFTKGGTTIALLGRWPFDPSWTARAVQFRGISRDAVVTAKFVIGVEGIPDPLGSLKDNTDLAAPYDPAALALASSMAGTLPSSFGAKENDSGSFWSKVGKGFRWVVRTLIPGIAGVAARIAPLL